MEWVIALVLKPFALVAVLCLAYPIKRYVERMPDCKLKRFLLISW
jgi:hypothetical protein